MPHSPPPAGFSTVFAAADFLTGLSARWCIAGGWALDLFLGKVTRTHLDLDLCVFTERRVECVEYFLGRGWRVEAKLSRGFKRITASAEWTSDMPYFWAVTADADFLPAYTDANGDRKFRYQREEQRAMDFAEVYFPTTQYEVYVCAEDPRIQRPLAQAVRRNYGVDYLAPELALFHKAAWPKTKDLDDLQRVWPALADGQRRWLRDALQTAYPDHPWLDQPPLSAGVPSGDRVKQV